MGQQHLDGDRREGGGKVCECVRGEGEKRERGEGGEKEDEEEEKNVETEEK